MRKKVLRRLIAVVVLLSVTAAGRGIYRFLQEEPQATTQGSAALVTEFARPKLVGWLKGERQWTVSAQSMNDTGDTVTINQIEEGIIYREGQAYFTFQAEQGVWRKAQGPGQGDDLHLNGGVQVYKDHVRIFETDDLRWLGAEQMLHAPGAVRFEYEENKAVASSMSFNAVTEEVTLSDRIEITLADGTEISIHGRLIYNLKDKTFHIEGVQEFIFNG